MGKLIEQVVSHFNSQVNRPITIPEWGGVTIYARTLTVADKTKWTNLATVDGSMDYGLFMVYGLIYGYVDDKGSPVFDLGDKVSLHKQADNTIIGRLFDHLITMVGPTDGDREKN